MGTVVLVSCAKHKTHKRAMAKDMYISPLFKMQLRFAESLKPSKIFILSAKHKLLDLDEVIEPYDVTLNDMDNLKRKQWSREVIEKLKLKTNLENDDFIFLAGAKYREYLTPKIRHFTVPMDGLSIGRQLHFLKERLYEF